MALKLVHLYADDVISDRLLTYDIDGHTNSNIVKFRACLTYWRAQARAATAQTPVNAAALIRALEHIERLAAVAMQRNIQVVAQDMIVRAAAALLDAPGRDERLRRLSCELDRTESITPI